MVNGEAILRRTHRIHGRAGKKSRIREDSANLIGPIDQSGADPHRPPDYVAGTGLSDTPATGNIAAGHITQPST